MLNVQFLRWERKVKYVMKGVSTMSEVEMCLEKQPLCDEMLEKMNDKLIEHKQYIAEYGQDLEEIRNWEWHK